MNYIFLYFAIGAVVSLIAGFEFWDETPMRERFTLFIIRMIVWPFIALYLFIMAALEFFGRK